MHARLGVIRAGEQPAQAIADHSLAALDRPLAPSLVAELWVAIASSEALVLGAFQRGAGIAATGLPLLRRGSGGPEVRIGPGTIHIALALSHPGALVPCDEHRIVNRSVRPLLRGLTKAGSLAHFFGRDWVSVGHRPVGWVGFAHDTGSRRTVLEAFIAVQTPFALDQRPSFLGKSHGTLDVIAGHALNAQRIADAIVESYVAASSGEVAEVSAAAGTERTPVAAEKRHEDARADPPWTAMRAEAIGPVGAGRDARGNFRVGGDLLVSRDALARLETRIDATADPQIGAIVDETLGAPGVALDGIRSLKSVRDAILDARHA